MELYDENVEQKKSKIPMIIGICIAVLVIITILIVVGIIYLKNSITIIKIDGVRNNDIEEILYIEENEEGRQELYMPIIKMSQFFGYEGFTGDYKDKSEDKSKCHVTSENETAMFTKDSDTLIKITKNSEYEYVKLDKPVFEKDGELYTTKNGIEKAFNVSFSTDQKFKNINIYTMDFLVDYYAKQFSIEKYSTNFSDKKAIIEGMLIIEENRQYGVINVINKKYILETKYEAISYLPATTDFLVKSNGQYGIVTKEADIKVKTVYDEIKTMDAQKGLYLVKQNNAYGVINTNGDVIIEPEYKQIGIDIGKYVQKGVESQYILLDEVIPVKNDQGLWGFFNIKGDKITDFKYTVIGCQSSPASNSYPALVIPSYKIIVVGKDKAYNLMTSEGEELISGYILDSVYLKSNTSTEQNQFFMTSNNNTKVINVEEWLANIGR